ncbi:MAG: type I restriction-modification system subunit M [Carboxydocellales bacterium]
MNKPITQAELETYLWGSAILLRGHIDAGDYKQYIFPLLFFKRICDVYDEELAIALEESGGDEDFAHFSENHRFQVPEKAHWSIVRETTKDVGKAIQAAFRDIERANQDMLYGVFGDAPWTNKNRLPDSLLKELIEHFNAQTLSIANCPEDELGVGYEYLIKKFADDSGHTAQEFYTNRTVVHLMTEMLDPQPGEAIYDPTCGSAGMLLSAITHLKNKGSEWRNVKLYGQELNHLTSAIGRMNLFLHGVEDFRVIQGDTLLHPAFTDKHDALMQFDMVLANPPYSIKQWNRDAFASDPYGRNIFGTPPQGRADYAFFQHIIKSLKQDSGRCAILFPHGVLFRNEESHMREKLVEADVVECVLGLGKNLFYNSPMEACIVICRMNKPVERIGKVLFVNAVDEVSRERAQSFLEEEHIAKISDVYHRFADVDGFSHSVTKEEIQANGSLLSIPLYVKSAGTQDVSQQEILLVDAIDEWLQSSSELHQSMNKLFSILSSPPPDGDPNDGNKDNTRENEESTDQSIAAIQQATPKQAPTAYMRAVLAAEIVYQNYEKPRFGSVKLEKILFLCDSHLGLGERINQHYLRQPAGPYDPSAMRSIRSNLISHKWFNIKKIDNRGTKYLPMEKCGGHQEAFEKYFGNEKTGIQMIIDMFKNSYTRECEIVATLYSAWSDFLKNDIKPNDIQLVNEVLVNWNESKLKIPRNDWYKWLAWMKKVGLYPGGNFGKEAERI